MPFNPEKFRAATYEDRVKTIPMPLLADYFDEGESPELTVRGLSADEVFASMEAGNTQKTIDDVLTSIESNESKREQLREVLGIKLDLSPEFVRKLHLFILGVINPKIERDIALKIQRCFPSEFLLVCNTINALTGQGMVLKK